MGRRRKAAAVTKVEERPVEQKSESETPVPEQAPQPKEVNSTDQDIQFIKSLGYDTSQLEATTDPEKLKGAIADAKEKIVRIEEIKKQLARYEMSELENKIKALKEKFSDFNAVEEISKMFEDIKAEWRNLKEMKLKEELAGIEVPGFEEDLLRIWKMFETRSIEEIEKEVSLLKQRVKERFFEMQIVSSIVTAPDRAVGQRVIKARPEEVFMMDLNGKILVRYVRKWRTGNKNVLAKLLAESYKLQKEINSSYGYATKKVDSGIYELGMMKGTKFYMGIVATKELHTMTKQFLDKTLHLLEERYTPESLSVSGVTMVLKAFLNVYNKVSQISEDLNKEFEIVTETS
ncbi:MAG: hypothetical protein QXJ27_02375 [Thermoplasmata archaeon]